MACNLLVEYTPLAERLFPDNCLLSLRGLFLKAYPSRIAIKKAVGPVFKTEPTISSSKMDPGSICGGPNILWTIQIVLCRDCGRNKFYCAIRPSLFDRNLPWRNFQH
jgi:hypothetical protein